MENKIIVVTGGSGLLGRAIVADINKKGGIAINADKAVETNFEANTVNLDVSNEQSIDAMIEYIKSKYGNVNGLVNCAYPRTADWGNKFEDVSLDSWRKNVDMQMNSVFYIIQKSIATILNKGSIVNISSIYGVVGNDFTLYEEYGGTSAAAYCAIKGGIVNFTRYLASYYGRRNIRVNCVSPGGIFDNQHPSFLERYNAKVPMGRMGTPQDIAPSVSFLLSDEAGYITGQNLIVDGGWTSI